MKFFRNLVTLFSIFFYLHDLTRDIVSLLIQEIGCTVILFPCRHFATLTEKCCTCKWSDSQVCINKFYSCHSKNSQLRHSNIVTFSFYGCCSCFSSRRLGNFENERFASAWKLLKLTGGKLWAEKKTSWHKNSFFKKKLIHFPGSKYPNSITFFFG